MKNKFKKQLYISQRFLERSGTWTFQVQIRKGGFIVHKNFREKEYGSARIAYDQAILFRDKTVNSIVNNLYIDKNNKTVENCFIESFDIIPVSIATKNKHLYYFKNFNQLKDKLIQNIKPEDIQIHLNSFVDSFDSEMINRLFGVWKRIIKTALIRKYINVDLCKMVIIPESRIAAKNKKKKPVNKEDLFVVINLLKKSKLSDYTKTMYINFLLVLYFTGARPCEILALNKDDIKNNMLYINKELGSSTSQFGVIRKTKTPLSNRNIPINKQLLKVLKTVSNLNNSSVLFCKEDGTYYNQRKICQRIGKICKGKVEFNMYGLRHLFSTDLLMNGVDAKTHQELMGHSNYEMSLYYANSSDELKKKAIEDR